MMEAQVIRTQIQLTEQQARELKALAAEQGISLAELIRRRVSERGRVTVDAKARKQRFLALAGRYHSGLSDVSSEHDRHLAQAFRP